MPELMQRRELLKIASAAFVGLTTGKLGWSLPGELVQNVAKVADWKPAFFNPQQNDIVTVLTELIIPRTDTPGANDAKVHRYIDLFLSVANSDEQTRFTDGLASLDREAQKSYRKQFAKCTGDEQVALLNTNAGDPFFKQAKSMTSLIYFSTPEGYKELNKFGPPPSTFACEHPGGHTA